MGTFLAILAFGFALYLFFVTNNKIKSLKASLIIDEAKRELESLITEFNLAAARNIELLEDKISELNDLIKTAEKKITQLQTSVMEKTKPIIIEKIVEKKEEKKEEKQHTLMQNSISEEKVKKVDLKTQPTKSEEVSGEKISLNDLKQSRVNELKSLLREGKTREELVSMGYLENEINLVSFLLKSENSKGLR